MIYLRKKDDPINAIVAGFITGGILAIRGSLFIKLIFVGGATVAFKNAILGGVILGIIEGTSVFMNALQMKQQLKMMHEAQKQQQLQQQKQQELAQEKKRDSFSYFFNFFIDAEGGTWGDFQQDFDTAEIAKKDIGF
jgi:mitochondrial import inner membrane translocase subunit TIM17